MFGRIVALSIWQCCCIIKSAATANASMNPLSLSLSNRDVSHSYPTAGNHDWASFEILPWVGVIHVRWPEGYFTAMYPLSNSRTIDTVKGKPLTHNPDRFTQYKARLVI
jgi:hypothetical protein